MKNENIEKIKELETTILRLEEAIKNETNENLVNLAKTLIAENKKKIQELKQAEKDKTLPDKYTAVAKKKNELTVAPKKQEIVVIDPATPKQKEQAKGIWKKVALIGAGVLATIALVTGAYKLGKDSKDKTQDDKSLDNNNPTVGQDIEETQPTTEKSEAEKIADEAIASQDAVAETTEEELEAEAEAEAKAKAEAEAEAKAKKEAEAKAEKETEEKAKKEAEAKKDTATQNTNNGNNGNNNNANNNGGNGNNNSASQNTNPSGNIPGGIQGTVISVTEELVSDNPGQQVIGEWTTTTGGNQTGTSETIEGVSEILPDLEGGQVAQEGGNGNTGSSSTDTEQTKPAQNAEETQQTGTQPSEQTQPSGATATETGNAGNEGGTTTEEVVEEEIVLPEGLTEQEVLALLEAYNQNGKMTAVGDGFTDPNQVVETQGKGKGK